MAVKRRTSKKDKVVGRPWPPGVSGNPGGRPKLDVTLSDTVRRIGNEIDEKTGLTRLESLLRRLYQDARNGKVAAAALILERGWGKTPIFMELNWREEARQLIASGRLTLAGLKAEFGDTLAESLARELFIQREEEKP